MASSAARALRDAVAANLGRVRDRLARACARAGRDPGEVTLVLATKYGALPYVATLVELGVLDLGENRAERILELDASLPSGLPRPRWHMIGHLQRNKARKVAGALHALHSLDSAELATKLAARRAELALPPLPVYIEVNLAGEKEKSGVAPDAIEALAASLRPIAGIELEGLMAIPPEAEDPEATRPWFRKLRELLPLAGASALSMGMSHDFEVAIEEGATTVRVGRALTEGVPGELLRAESGGA
jgi:pyridoxal phosphate enzyme (YggS family)